MVQLQHELRCGSAAGKISAVITRCSIIFSFGPKAIVLFQMSSSLASLLCVCVCVCVCVSVCLSVELLSSLQPDPSQQSRDIAENLLGCVTEKVLLVLLDKVKLSPPNRPNLG